MGPAASGERLQLETDLFKAFNESQRKAIVEVTAGPDGSWGGLREKFTVRHAGGDPVDVVANGWGTWTDMSDGGMFAELTPLLKREKAGAGTGTFIPGALEAFTGEDKVWGLPVSVSSDAIAYNIDLFDAAGLKHPPVNPDDKTWTMEKFQEYAQKLTRGSEQFGFGGVYSGFGTAGVADGSYFQQAPWDDKAKKGLMDAPTFQKGLQFWSDLETKLRAQPTAAESATLRGGQTTNVFLTGKIGMQAIFSIFPKEQVPFKWGLATLPSTGAGRNQSGRTFPLALHLGKSPRTDAAWEVLNWLTKPENGGRFPLTAGHAVSPLAKGGSDAAQKTRREQSGIDPKAWVLQAQYSQLSAGGMLKYPGWTTAGTELTPKFADFRAQKIGVGEYARTATETINRLLAPKR